MDAHDLNLQTPATVWWMILLIGIAFIVGGLAIALNRIQDRRRPGWKDATYHQNPGGVGKSWVNDLLNSKVGEEAPARYESRKVIDPHGPFPRCVPMDFVGGGCCRNCGFPIDDDSLNACRASNPKDRFRIEWGVETMLAVGPSSPTPTPEKAIGLHEALDVVDHFRGNVDFLTRRQIGIGWRIADHSEQPHPDAQVWEPYYNSWARRLFNKSKPYEITCTYRVPVEGKE